MEFHELLGFLENEMRMSHVYQPVMIRRLLEDQGRASVEDIARSLLNEDRSQIEYYSEITKTMVGRVLVNRGVVRRHGRTYELVGFEGFSEDQVRSLLNVCDRQLSSYINRRGNAIWDHRRRSHGYIPGSLKYEVLKAAKFRCELCGISADERALEPDHIQPRNKGGPNDFNNLQALCYRCNSMKRDRDNTDFRAVRASRAYKEPGCALCVASRSDMKLENTLAYVARDTDQLSAEMHLLIVPRRHVDYFELGTAEFRACHQLLIDASMYVKEKLAGVSEFKVTVSSRHGDGKASHCQIHLIPIRVPEGLTSSTFAND